LAAIAKSYGRLALNDVAVIAGPRQLRRWSLLHPVAASPNRAETHGAVFI
jgi:hypothetical protein